MTTTRPLSCLQCKKRKVKCDRQNPCGQCSTRGEEDQCQALVQFSSFSANDDGPSSNKRRKPSTTPYEDDVCNANHALLFDRLLELDRRVRQLEARSDDVDDSVGQSASSYDVKANTNQEQISLMIEDVTMGYRASQWKKKQEQQREEQIQIQKQRADRDKVLNQRTSDHVADIIFQYLDLLPSERVVRTLIAFYFDNLDWFTRSLNKSLFFTHIDQWYIDLASTDKGVDFDKIDPSFFCCFLIVICLSLHFMDVDAIRQLGVKEPEALAESTFAGAQQLLWASNFLGDPQLDQLACIVLMGLYQYDKKQQADAHWILLGAAVKAAQNIGLGNINSTAHWRTASEAERDRGRRIWLMLVWFDWSHAFGHNGHYSILPQHNETTLPADALDEVGDSASFFSSLTGHTVETFIVARSRLVAFYREATDAFHFKPRKSISQRQMDELDERLNDVLAKMPKLYTEPILTCMSKEQLYESFFIRLTMHNRILRLHRHAQKSGLNGNEASAKSRRKCFQAASSIVDLIKQAQQFAPVLVRFWVIVLYAIGAGLVLFMEQCERSGERGKKEIDSLLNALLEMFEDNQHRSHSAKNAARLLRRLRQIDHEIGDGADVERDDLMAVFESIRASGPKRREKNPTGFTSSQNDRISDRTLTSDAFNTDFLMLDSSTALNALLGESESDLNRLLGL